MRGCQLKGVDYYLDRDQSISAMGAASLTLMRGFVRN
jgi:hypothetical protein